MASGSVSVNASVIELGVAYDVSYSCSSTPFTLYASINLASGTSFRVWGYDGLTDSSGTKTFSLSVDEYISAMEARGESVEDETVETVSFTVFSNDFEVSEVASYAADFAIYSACGAPTSVTVDNASTTEATNIIRAYGATAGENNPIAGYFIQYSDSSDGETWNGWSEYGQTTTTSDTVSLMVYMPEAGQYRKWKVWTLGTASGYDSETGCESPAAYRAAEEDEPLPEWSETITAGETAVRAAHMTELQTAADILRARAGLAGGSYTPAVSGETGLALWSAQIAEIRAAIDEIGTTHDTWINADVNCPSAAVMNQLRSVMESM